VNASDAIVEGSSSSVDNGGLGRYRTTPSTYQTLSMRLVSNALRRMVLFLQICSADNRQ
jgi:hypothetical protein